MAERRARDYPPWLRRISNNMHVGIRTLEVSVHSEFADRFAEYCNAVGIDFEIEVQSEFEQHSVFLIQYTRDLEYDSLDEQLQDLPWLVADYLKEAYGDESPDSRNPKA